jgi:FKBP-type peptidyl-prolyl cis-trans isomerase
MRFASALFAAVGLVAAAAAAHQPATPPTTKQPAPAQPETPATPQAIPVPDGPVVARKELEGGLLIEDIKIGDGYEVKEHGAIVAHYHGTLKADPTKVFDSSFNRGLEATFALDGVIQGWQKGVPGMKVGGVRRLTIPAALAYGARSPTPDIPANSDLVFVIEVVDALQVEDVKIGEGEACDGQFIAVTTHVMRNAEGREVEKAEPSKPYIWLPGEMNAPQTNFDTMQLALNGMKPGGKRKIKIPRQMNGAPPTLPMSRPSNVPLTVDVELVAARNLPQQGRRR